MENYLVAEKYKISYICWDCEKFIEHELELYLKGYGDDLDLSYLSFCPSCEKYERLNDLADLLVKQGYNFIIIFNIGEKFNRITDGSP